MKRTWFSSPHRLSSALVFALILLTATAAQESVASRGGVEDPSNRFAVAITYKDNGFGQICSGVLIYPRVVATAAHCVTSHHGGALTEFTFTDPGVNIEDPVLPNEVVEIIKSDRDLAFIVLKSSLRNGKYLEIADSGVVSSLPARSSLFGYGFGAVFEEFTLYSKIVRRYVIEWSSQVEVIGSKNTYEVTSSRAVACVGDSGGPVTTVIDGREILLGVMASAAGVTQQCGNPGEDGIFRMKMTLLHPYISLLPATATASEASPTPSTSPKLKTKRIVCVKGSKKRVVIGVNPKCPKGYRLKK